MKDETIIGLRATKAAVPDYGGVQNVPITLDMIKDVKMSHHLYTEDWRQEAAKKSTKEAEKAKVETQKKKKLKKRKAVERALDEKLQKLKMEEREVHDAMGKALSYIDEGEKKIHDGIKAGNIMEVEAGKQTDRIWKAETI